MRKTSNTPQHIRSISEWYALFSMQKPQHPLITLVRHAELNWIPVELQKAFLLDFYIIAVKKSFKGKMRYGKNYYDFDEGTMSFISPGQVISVEDDDSRDCLGWSLMFHADFIRNYPLAKNIKNYGFFSYSVNEALHLSDKEDNLLQSLIAQIEQEYHAPIDQYSQDVMVSQLELLLNYANRFYNRQFITRKPASSDLLVKLEELLDGFFQNDLHTGLPTVQSIAEKLNVSSSYLSDMLRTLTGQNAQQHIHNKLIEVAKQELATTAFTVSEIAYRLGFEHPQSFNKLFKSKTNVSPLQFRNSFS